MLRISGGTCTELTHHALRQVYTYCIETPREKARSRQDMDGIFTFLFSTRAGLAVLFFGGIVIIGIIAFVTEKRTHQMYVDRGPASEDEDGWTL